MSATEGVRRPALLRKREDYKVAIVAALPKEKDAVDAILEHRVPRQDTIAIPDEDFNHYTFGVLGNHHVVVTQLPGMGKVNATTAAVNMRRSFPNIKLCLLVGICGIVPVTEKDDERSVERFLGDVVIADSIIQYDFGHGTEGGFVRKSTVTVVPGRPSTKVQNILAHLQTWQGKLELQADLAINLEALLSRTDIPPDSTYPSNPDLAFPLGYIHRHIKDPCPTHVCEVKPPCPAARGKSCMRLGCDPAQQLPRERRPVSNKPLVFVGTVGVADLVQKSAMSRDEIAASENVVAFEMESVGLWDNFPDVVVIKSACDYADSHKNDFFHRYASATSAACAKAFLQLYRLEGNVHYDEAIDSRRGAGGAHHDPREDQTPSVPQGSNVYSGQFHGSAFGANSTVNNK